MTAGGELLAVGAHGWEEALKSMRHDFHHLAAYNQLEADRLGGEATAFVYRDGDRRFMLPLVLREIDQTGRIDAVSAYGYPGPLTCDEGGERGREFRQEAGLALSAALRERGCVSMFVRMHPLLSPLDGLGTGAELVFHGETVVIDLTLTEEEMWRQVRRDHRTQIHRARRRGLTASIDSGWQKLDDFLEIYCQSMVRVGANSSYFFPPEYFDGLRHALPGKMVLCDISDGERTICAGLFSNVCDIVQFHLSGTRDEYLRERPSKFMLDSVRKWAHGQRAREFHLGGGVGSKADSLFEFKAGFSRRRAPFYTWRRILDAGAYDRLTRDRGHDPTAQGEGFFPLYRALEPGA